MQAILNDKATKLFIILAGFFIANALSAEFMGVKIFSFEKTFGLHWQPLHLFGGEYSFNLAAGVLLWPVVFIMTDIINEYYGRKGVQFLSWLGVGLIAYCFFMFYGTIKLAPADFWTGSKSSIGINDMSQAYNVIFGQGLGIIVGSLTAFIVSQVLDVFIFHRIKRATGDKHLWLRATGSTFFSQFIDSYLILFVAFYWYPTYIDGSMGAPWSVQQILTIGTGGYIYKVVMAFLMTPIVYLAHYAIESYLGMETATNLKNKAMGIAI